MYQLLLGLYVLVCFLLVVFILMQQGRGGGLVESFSAAETLFGGKTNIYMVRITIVLGTLFLGSALLLNYVVVQRSKSIMERFFYHKKSMVKPTVATNVGGSNEELNVKEKVNKKIKEDAGKQEFVARKEEKAVPQQEVGGKSPVVSVKKDTEEEKNVLSEKGKVLDKSTNVVNKRGDGNVKKEIKKDKDNASALNSYDSQEKEDSDIKPKRANNPSESETKYS